jgi:hypothetical protein
MKLYELSTTEEYSDTPLFYYGNLDFLNEKIEKGREIISSNDINQVTYWSIIPTGTFLASEEVDDVFDMSSSELTWLEPELDVNMYTAKLVWKSKYDNNELILEL